MFKVRLIGVAILMALGVLLIWLPQPPVVAAGPTTVTLVIGKGGDRTAAQSVSGPAGAVFDFFAGTSDAPPAAGATPTASCTTTAPAGTCSVDVPGRNTGEQGYWIRERTAPTGYSIPETLDIGFGSATAPTVYNQLFTGHVANNTTRTFPEAETGNNNLTARGNAWADIRNNPAIPDRCGLNIALLIDTSGSIAPFLDQVKSAANGFVDALTGTPSQIAVFRFASDASSVLAPTPVPDATSANTVKAAINGLTATGGTNWDAGLFQVAAAPLTFDALVMLTDGNPTFYGPPPAAGPGNNTRFREVENGIFSANAVKALGTKVVAVGVGDGVTGAAENLQAISGPVRGTDFIQANYAELAAIFRELALRTCSGTISVVKKVISPTGTFDDAMPTGGWTYNVPAGNTTPTTGVTADGSGAVSFAANLGGQPSVPVTIAEVSQPGFTLEQRNGQNATCVSDGAPVTSANVGALSFTVTATRNAIVSCTVYNRAAQPPASVTVTKTWFVNGTRYSNPQQPAAFQAALRLTGQANPQWSSTYSDYVAGASVTIGETIDEKLLPPGCTIATTGDVGAHVLVAGLNAFEVTNTATCVSRLQLLKRAVNPYGPAEPETSWTLSAYPPGSGTPAITGTSGVSDVVTPDQKYLLGETSVPGYLQEQLAVDPIPAPATGSWHCSLRQRDGTLGPEYDGLNGGVTVAIGQNAECTAVNTAQPAKLTLHKTVDNSHGGTAVNTDWVLSAIPAPKLDVLPIVGRDGEPSVTGATAEPQLAYTLSESGPGGYEQAGAVSCVLTGTTTSAPAPGGVLVPAIGQDITCTFANRDLAPSPSPTPSAVTPTESPTSPPLPSTGSGIKAMTVTGVGAILGGLILLLAAIRRRA